MNIRRSFEILELDHGATEDDARQAYKDIVNVWHPDRFSTNPRLKQKAEQKLKEVNVAYETIRVVLQKCETSTDKSLGKTNEDLKNAPEHHGSKPGGRFESRTRTEIAAEAGTVIVLSLYSYVSEKLNHILERDHLGPSKYDV